MKTKLPTKATVTLKVYPIIEDAVSGGVRLGWNRAHKHTDTPSEDAIWDAIESAVMGNLSDVIQWNDA